MAGTFEKFRGRHYLPVGAFLLLTLLIGLAGVAFVQQVTGKLLENEARLEAERWAAYLSRNITDIAAVANGSAPSEETLRFIAQARDAGRIYSFRIYDNAGNPMLRSDPRDRPLDRGPAKDQLDTAVAEALASGEPETFVRTGTRPGEPAYYAISIIPITANDGKVTGWLAANIDQTTREALFFDMALHISLGVGCLLMIASGFGFWYRARQRAFVEKQIETFSAHDQLTGLPNMSSLLDNVGNALETSASAKAQCALVVCEIAGLSANGQLDADSVVLAASRILQTLQPAGSYAAYLGQGRFALFLEDVSDPMTVLSLARNLTVKIGKAQQALGSPVAAPVYAGIALSASDGNTAAELLRSAELALQAAQEQETPGYGFFNPDIAQTARRRSAVQRALTEALANETFRLDFQPVYTIRSGELSGFEALLRLHDPELGNVSPAEFIPVAEQMGIINRMGGWCLSEACRIASQWPAHIIVAVNLSPFQFYSGTLIGDVRQALEQNRFPSYRLEVEITEGTLLKDSELVLHQLRALRDMGVAVALDDFGTGFSSLSYLWKFPFSKLKIDRSFISALDESSSARGILRSIIKLGHGLGLSVTAEGIETTKQMSTLRELGCDLAQGFLLDRPALVTDLAAIILRNFASGLTRRQTRAAVTTPKDFAQG